MPNLLFLMTPGVNLSAWKDNGTFSREISPYLEYARSGFHVRIISFGNEAYDFSSLHANIAIIPAAKGLIWYHLLPFSHWAHFVWADVVKTNQSYAAWIFSFASKMFGRYLVLRCGYVHGEYLESVSARSIFRLVYHAMEGWAFRNASQVIVTTDPQRDWVSKNYHVPVNQVAVIPNFVDAESFRPRGGVKQTKSVVSVGRLHPVKRFDLLIRACAKVPGCSLTIIGDGPELETLSMLAKRLGVNLELPGILPNTALPDVLPKYSVFAVTSLREGHPKALIEAMSCGLPCVGAFKGGEVFSDAIVSVDDTDSLIAAAIQGLFADRSRAELYSLRARGFVLRHYAFPKVFHVEKELLLRYLSR